jgi:uncharacterized membrane protein YdfJ with MMPL/SSD domain
MIAPVRRLGHFAYRRRAVLVLISVWVTVAAALGSASLFDRVKPFGFQDPNSESARAADAIEAATGERALPEVVLLIQPHSPTAIRPASNRAARMLSTVPDVARIVTSAQDRQLTSTDHRDALVVGFISSNTDDIANVGKDVQARFDHVPGVVPGGPAVAAHQLSQTTEDDLSRIEFYALPILLLLSFLVFRGLVAAALPVIVGGISILFTLLLLNLLTAVMQIDVFAINIVTGLGLGLAIDYSLFLVSRFREELEKQEATWGALVETMASTGRMVLFSGLTVGVALAALAVFPQRFLYSLGVGGALVALSSAAVCLLILPAVLAMLGPRVNALAPRRLQGNPSPARWRALAGFVLRHPVSVATVTIVAMVVVAVPFLKVDVTRADARVLPTNATAREVDDAIRRHFAFDPASRVVIAIERPRAVTLAGASHRLGSDPSVDDVSKPVRLREGLVRVDAQLTVGPYTNQALDVVREARALNWGGPTRVGGPPAEFKDQTDSLSAHLPLAIGLIVVATVLILFVMTRSVTLPLVSLLMNGLTVSVAFGVLVFVFQDGRLQSALNYTSQGALDTSMPILLFAVAFGLSTDYGVFLLQRINEARRRTGDTDTAITEGMAASGRQITAAALLFAVAMGAFVFSDLVYVKEIAVGTAVAVLVDATIVRAFLFPAILKLLGKRAWWAPRWLAGTPPA